MTSIEVQPTVEMLHSQIQAVVEKLTTTDHHTPVAELAELYAMLITLGNQGLSHVAIATLQENERLRRELNVVIPEAVSFDELKVAIRQATVHTSTASKLIGFLERNRQHLFISKGENLYLLPEFIADVLKIESYDEYMRADNEYTMYSYQFGPVGYNLLRTVLITLNV